MHQTGTSGEDGWILDGGLNYLMTLNDFLDDSRIMILIVNTAAANTD